MSLSSDEYVLVRIAHFIKEIGLSIHERQLPSDTFLPGILIDEGTIYYDSTKLKHPGDLLHEAGHLALMEPEKRALASGDLEPGNGLKPDSLEIGAILWSYAALTHLNIAPEIVFHEAGYKGASDWYIEAFRSGNYVGLPLLQWMGLCAKEDPNELPFPKMQKWVRES